jgi:hypothetical protein
MSVMNIANVWSSFFLVWSKEILRFVPPGVGKPTMLGQKLKQHFIVDNDKDPSKLRRCMEVMVDVSSNPMANRIVKLALGFAKTLAIDLMFLLEAGGEGETNGGKKGNRTFQDEK